MPPLAPRFEQPEWERMAKAIYDYLRALRQTGSTVSTLEKTNSQ
jgi:hypothetical protein